MMFRNIVHLGYVIRDIDKVMENMREKYGVGKWKVLRLPEDSPVSALGFAYSQAVMIELLEVSSQAVAKIP